MRKEKKGIKGFVNTVPHNEKNVSIT